MALTFDEAVQTVVADEVRRVVLTKIDNTYVRQQVCVLMGIGQSANVNKLDVIVTATDGVISVQGIEDGDEDPHDITLPPIVGSATAAPSGTLDLPFVADPATAWEEGESVSIGGVAFYWDGSAWQEGTAPAA